MPRLAALLAVVSLAAPVPAQTASLPPEQVKAIKAATVYVKVAAGPRRSSGSGFVIKSEGGFGYLVTNDHVVVGPKTGYGMRLRTAVEVVFNSGTATEWTAPADVVGRDLERDLAVLRIRPAGKTMPPPISLAAPDKLTETQPVFVCGFPFGEMLAAGDKNPEISIGLASISSIRTNDRNELSTVQLNGALNPGNSGGPVIATDGKLVGVAVRTVKGAGIGEAVPGPSVGELLRGRVGGSDLIQLAELADARQAILVGQVADPFNKLRSARGLIAPVGGQTSPPTNVGSLAGHQAVPLRLFDASVGVLAAVVTFPQRASAVWVQVEWTDVEGRARRGPTFKVAYKSASQIEREEEEAIAAIRQFLEQELGIAPAPPGRRAPDPGTPAAPPRGRPGSGTLPPTPPGQLTMDELNRNPAAYLGQTVTVDALVTGPVANGYGDGPALAVVNAAGTTPGQLDFVVSAEMLGEYRRMVPTVQGMRTPARLRGTVRTSSRASWRLLVIDEIGLLAADGAVTASILRSRAANPPLGATGRANLAATSAALWRGAAAEVKRGTEQQFPAQVVGLADAAGGRLPARGLVATDLTGASVPVTLYLSGPLADAVDRALVGRGRLPFDAQITFRPSATQPPGGPACFCVTAIRMYDADFVRSTWSAEGGFFSLDLPAARPVPAATPERARPTPPTPTPTGGTSPDKPAESSGTPRWLYLVLGLVLLAALGCGGYALMKFADNQAKAKKKAALAKIQKRNARRDADEGDPPRVARRPRGDDDRPPPPPIARRVR